MKTRVSSTKDYSSFGSLLARDEKFSGTPIMFAAVLKDDVARRITDIVQMIWFWDAAKDWQHARDDLVCDAAMRAIVVKAKWGTVSSVQVWYVLSIQCRIYSTWMPQCPHFMICHWTHRLSRYRRFCNKVLQVLLYSVLLLMDFLFSEWIIS